MTNRITLLTSGTRGDVQPLVALGLGLQQAGYTVRIATHAAFRPLIAERGLEFALLAANPNDLLHQGAGQSALVYNGNVQRSAYATLQYLRAVRPVFGRMLIEAWHACQDSAALIVTLPTTWGQQIAERLGIPCCWALLQPLGRTRAFPSPLLPFSASLGGSYNLLTHRLVEQLLWQPWRGLLNRWRQQTLGLSALPWSGPYRQIYAQGVPFIYGFSPHVVPRPRDWPASHRITGYWFLDPPLGWQPPPDLATFLANGPPPIYIGFGSLGNRWSPAMLGQAATHLAQRGQRVVLQVDPASVPSSLHPNIFVLRNAVSHSWLFPHMAAVVHHGGAGTTAAALRAGVPTLIVAIGIDQFFWGQQVARLGVGLASLHQANVKIAELVTAVQTLTANAAIGQRAAQLGVQIRSEDGVAAAVAQIHARV